jgi:hypothetical protein
MSSKKTASIIGTSGIVTRSGGFFFSCMTAREKETGPSGNDH